MENDIRRSSRKLDTSSISRRRTTDRNWTRRPVPRGLASLRALLRTIIPPSFHLTLHPRAPFSFSARYPLIMRRKDSTIGNYTKEYKQNCRQFLLLIKPNKMSLVPSHTRRQSIHFSRSRSKTRGKRNTDIKRLQKERERERERRRRKQRGGKTAD